MARNEAICHRRRLAGFRREGPPAALQPARPFCCGERPTKLTQIQEPEAVQRRCPKVAISADPANERD
jgi:hypothetical protein